MPILEALLAALGLRELARRAGVSEATLKRWLRQGPSGKGSKVLDAIFVRRQRSLKASATRRRKETEAFQASLPVPPKTEELDIEGAPAGYLPAILPEKPPRKARETATSYRGVFEGRTTIDTLFNRGEETWFTIGKPVLEVDLQELIDDAVRVFQDSGRDYVSVRFLLFRYIARGSLRATVDKWGTWQEWWINSDVAVSRFKKKKQSTPDSLGRRMGYYWQEAERAAQSRVIWCEGMGVTTFDRIEEHELGPRRKR